MRQKKKWETGFKFPKQNYLACCKTFLLISMLGMSALKISVCGRIALKQTSNWNFLVLKYTEKKKNWVFRNRDPTRNRPTTIRKL